MQLLQMQQQFYQMGMQNPALFHYEQQLEMLAAQMGVNIGMGFGAGMGMGVGMGLNMGMMQGMGGFIPNGV